MRLRFPGPIVQMLCALAAGLLLGWVDPALAVRFKPVSDLFIFAINLLMAPIVFVMVASGISGMGTLRQFGRVGLHALIYFEIMSVLSLGTGLAAGWLLEPGTALTMMGASAADGAVGTPSQAVSRAFASSLLLQALLLAICSGMLMAAFGRRAERQARWCEHAARWLLRLMRLLLIVAPLAAFSAIAYATGRHGLDSVGSLASMLAALYLATAVFMLVVVGGVAWLCGLSLLRFIMAIRGELVLVAATSSSVAAMPGLMRKLEQAGCDQAVVAAVVPASYSFNLNGSNVYLGMGLVFLAQLQQAPMSLGTQMAMLAVLMLTSKGASGVAGSSFMILVASASMLPGHADGGLALLLGVERLLKCRVLANLLGNGVACIAVCAWSRRLDYHALTAAGLARKRFRAS
jgi:aerobic C4-dicarboxylate transport protein